MYVYDDLRKDCCRMCGEGVDCGSIGRSVSGAHIICFHVGPLSGDQIIVQGGIHAREWVTALLVMRMAFAARNSDVGMGVFFLPMTNPDGCTLAQAGADAFPEHKAELLRLNGGGSDFALWKANLRGVDLNCNFDARHGKGASNVAAPAPESYPGPYPESEPETAALARFTRAVRPAITLSYLALGREVYYVFGQTGERLARDERIARLVADELGYTLVPGDLGSAGGYKDWCITQGITALTLETVSPDRSHPLNERDLDGEENNLWILKTIARAWQPPPATRGH